jgi:hypothetical protein
MKWLAIVASLWLAAIANSGSAAARADGLQGPQGIDLSAQRKRPRLRIYRQPGPYSYPSPNAVRECRAWYITEYRPSGPVITPQMRCRWVPG